jgi:hypothetical protein
MFSREVFPPRSIQAVVGRCFTLRSTLSLRGFLAEIKLCGTLPQYGVVENMEEFHEHTLHSRFRCCGLRMRLLQIAVKIPLSNFSCPSPPNPQHPASEAVIPRILADMLSKTILLAFMGTTVQLTGASALLPDVQLNPSKRQLLLPSIDASYTDTAAYSSEIAAIASSATPILISTGTASAQVVEHSSNVAVERSDHHWTSTVATARVMPTSHCHRAHFDEPGRPVGCRSDGDK